MQATTRPSVRLLGALWLSCSACASPNSVTICQPTREAEVPVFECSPPTKDDYTVGFDQAKDLVCMPIDDYGRLKNKECP